MLEIRTAIRSASRQQNNIERLKMAIQPLSKYLTLSSVIAKI
jgi:hypothetical protein